MFFIGKQAVLIEVQKRGEQYLIGDEIFSSLPTKVLNKVLSTANWNRSLRYLNTPQDDFIHCGFFLIRFELYLKDNKVVCLSKNSFEQKILDQVKFQNEFLAEIFAFRNRNHQLFQSKEFPKNDDLELSTNFPVELNRCWVSDNFSLKNHKFKILFKKGQDFKIEKTKYGQVIYYSDFAFGDWDVFDLKNANLYQEGRYQFNVDVCLNLMTEAQDLKIRFINYLIEQIKKSDKLKEEHKNWHLFNLTNDAQYLENELIQIFKNYHLLNGIEYLDKVFKELQNSYFSFLFQNPGTKNIFFQFANLPEEKDQLKMLINRYGILNSNDLKKLI